MFDDRLDLFSTNGACITSNFLTTFSEISDDQDIFKHQFIVGRFPVVGKMKIPGMGSIYRSSCGTIFKAKRCLETKTVQLMHQYCYKVDCPICYHAWAYRTSERIVLKLFALQRVLPIYHWMISFPEDWTLEEQKQLIKDHFSNGYAFYHPYRLQDEDGISYRKSSKPETLQWVSGQHWHLISWVEWIDSTTIFNEYKVVTKRIKEVELPFDSLSRLVSYELSHVGISELNRAIMFNFGLWSNSKIANYLYAEKIEYFVKCNCEECATYSYYEERSDCEVTKVDLFNSSQLFEPQNNRFIVVSEGKILDSYDIFKKKTIFYFPRRLENCAYVSYLRRLGILQQINKLAVRHHQITVDDGKFAGGLIKGVKKSMFPREYLFLSV